MPQLGFKRLSLETDAGALARRGVTTLLGRLGFDELFVVLGGLSETVHDEVLGEPGTLRVALEGLARAVAGSRAGGPRVYLVAPLLRSNAGDLEALVDWATGLGELQGFLLSLPEIARVPPDRRGLLLPYSTQAEIAARLFRKCQGRNVEYGFTSKRGILPCATGDVLEHFATVFFDRSQYFRHSPEVGEREEFVRVDACGDCS